MRIIIKIVVAISLIFIGLMAWVNYEYNRFISTPLNIPEQGYNYLVKPGSNLQSISTDLTEAGLSSFHDKYLPLYGRLKNKSHLIKAGEYKLEANTTLPQLLEQLIEGKVIQYSFTIVEGMTSQQLIDSIIANKSFTRTLDKTSLKQVMLAIGLENKHGEGEFQPETYYFSAGTTDKSMLLRAHKAMSKTLEQAWNNKAEGLPYKTPYEALIMASIIEKESGIAEERPQIAGVFVRRLKIGMRLQTDPTVIYGMGDSYNGNIRRKDLRTDTIYNTYTRFGLPPTPIALPSKEAIEAALHPLAGKSLYFVATGKEGRHQFSNTLTAHNKAVRKYQLKR
ncbi:MAG: aminodeoxychorismate lyase [Gammaproteobacteria bacterium]|nr:MAG: aminodeoxychorismate lyase [Gammaproteobacteria bacterium]